MKYVIALFTIYYFLSLVLAPAKAQTLGDWKNLERKLGWSPFNKKGQSFDPAINIAYCKQHTIRIAYNSGTKDYSGAINAAFEALSARTPPGGTVKLDAGTYALNKQLTLGSYSCLIGASMNDTIIRMKNNSPRFKQAGIIRSMHTKHITVKDLTIDGNRKGHKETNLAYGGYGRYGLFTELTNYLYITTCY